VSRFLFAVLPLSGHVNAPLAVADELGKRGHEVAWCGPETYLRPLVGPDATVYPTGMRYYREQGSQGMDAVRSLWTSYLIPFNRFILAALDRAVGAYRPDVLVTDQHALAGGLVGHRHGLRWATLAPGALELTRPLRDVPGAEDFVDAALGTLWGIAGLPRDPAVDLRFSPYLVIAFSTAALTGTAHLPPNCALVGPALGRRRTDPGFPFERLDPGRQRVLVTVGTLSDEVAADFVARTVAALAGLADRVQGVVVGTVPEAPENALVLPRVPMLDLLPHVHAVVCHGGMGTVGEALAHGIPLVVAPIRHDQPYVAAQVSAAGAGVRVPFAEVTPDELRAAIVRVLDEPSYRQSARRIADEFDRAGGSAAAADQLIKLANIGNSLP